MTLEQEAKERADFERWAARLIGPTKRSSDGMYLLGHVETAWKAWRERAELPVDVC